MEKRKKVIAYNSALAGEILERLAEGQLLTQICADDNMPDAGTVRRWVTSDLDGFAKRYREAREAGVDAIAEDVITIADLGEADKEQNGRDKLRMDARQWYASKIAPRTYGTKQTTELTGPEGKPLEVSTSAETLAKILAAAHRRKEQAEDDAGGLV